eukprot:5999331-Pleurochrysis_carterae.AAC.1
MAILASRAGRIEGVEPIASADPYVLSAIAPEVTWNRAKRIVVIAIEARADDSEAHVLRERHSSARLARHA